MEMQRKNNADFQLALAPKNSMNGRSRAIAQPGSASVWGTEGRRFKSC